MKKLFVILLVIFLFSSSLVLGDQHGGQEDDSEFGEEGGDEPNYDDTSEWDSNDYESADYDKVNDWENFDPGQVPEGREGDVDLDNLNDNQMKSWNSNHIGNNLEHFKGKEHLLDQGEYSSALSSNSGRDIQVDANNQPMNHEEREDGLYFQNVPEMTVDDTRIIGASGVTIGSDFIHADNCETITIDDTEVQKCSNLFSQKKQFYVESADKIKFGCAEAENVRETNVEFDELSVSLLTKENVSFPVTDCATTRYQFTARSDPGLFQFTKGNGASRAFMTGSQINFTKEIDGEEIVEEILVEGQASVDVSKELGIVRAELNKASYFYKTGSFDSDFVMRGERNTLYLIKDSGQAIAACHDCSIVNFLTQTIEIDGGIDYKRYHVQADGKVLPSAKTLFKSDFGGKARLTFDKHFDLIETLDIQEDNPVYVISPSNYITIEERNNGTTSKYLKVTKQNKNTVSRTLIKKYISSYNNKEISFEEGMEYITDKEVKVILPDNQDFVDDQKEYFNQLPLISLALLGLLIPLRKKGNISLFIILGIILLFSLAVVFVATGDLASLQGIQKVKTLNDFYNAVDGYQEQSNLCIDEIGRSSLRKLGSHGGELEGTTKIDSNIIQTISKTELENKISKLVEENFPASECMTQLVEDMSKRGLDIETEQARANTIINEQGVNIMLDYPVTLEARAIQGATNKVDEYATIVNFPVTKIIDNTEEILNSKEGFTNIDALHTDTYFFAYNGELHTMSRQVSAPEMYQFWHTLE